MGLFDKLREVVNTVVDSTQGTSDPLSDDVVKKYYEMIYGIEKLCVLDKDYYEPSLYIVLFTKDHKVDAYEMKSYMENELKVKKSMALDGGLSTAVNYKNINIGSLGKYQRRVKSFN